jgi:hypothetical protein
MEEKMYTDAEVMTVMAWTANEVLKNYSRERDKIMKTGVCLGFLAGAVSTLITVMHFGKKWKEENSEGEHFYEEET